MKLKRARIGEKFVFTDKLGVWEKMPDGKAKMVFGAREDVGAVTDINQEDFVYVIFEGKGQKPKEPPPEEKKAYTPKPSQAGPVKKVHKSSSQAGTEQVDMGDKDGIDVVLIDDDEKQLAICKGVPLKKAMLMSGMDILRLKEGGKVYMLTDRGFDVYSNQVHLEVIVSGVE